MNEADKVAASQRVVELSTQRNLTDEEQIELTELRNQLATPTVVQNPEDDFINPLVTNSDE
ncbi:hypothetical protein AHMF7605_02190 [Adhaeribacter arboris]|uniref:Uncharacterized protein n=1 Tax=Adhaeribacter arboris TaxID=2072846 RepID=A0A2T2YA74_9BACT|nr:hypothetical protein [Adhaeribacter arboris]PSR52415.1 hypothetical protein AHMF7605_02190 [Adhaeribacter arboris]